MDPSVLPANIRLCYLRTDPGEPSWFAPPFPLAGDQVYLEQLRARYSECQHRDGERTLYFGLAQVVNRIVYAVRHRGLELVYLGLYAGALETFIQEQLDA